MTSDRAIGASDVAGVVHVDGVWHYALPMLATWYLDYPSFDPADVAVLDDETFRGGLAVVTPADGPALVAALAADGDLVALDELDRLIEIHGTRRLRPQVLVDFATAHLISWFYDQPVENHAGRGWTATFDDPVPHLPAELVDRFGG